MIVLLANCMALTFGAMRFVALFFSRSVMSKKRIKIGKRRARRDFRRGLKTDVKNLVPPPQRGGYRM